MSDTESAPAGGGRTVRRAPVLLLSILLLTSCTPAEPTRTGTGEGAQVAFVVDGDTVELTDGRRVRYVGINTPEIGQPHADEAQAFNETLVAGQAVWLETGEQARDQYDRLLAHVWVGDTFVNLALARQGYANAYTVPPNLRYADALARAEREAREAGRGLWAPADVPVRITGLNYDGPGSDRIAPNGEWVELTNEGDAPVDLHGYTLRDRGLHLYTFGAVALPPGATVRIYSGRGADTAAALYWGLADEEVWDRDGDTAYLHDPAGAFVDLYAYTS